MTNTISEQQQSACLQRIEATLTHLDRMLANPNDRNDLEAWKVRLAELRTALDQSLDAGIALMGESGAGKSSLLNALLSMDFLPHDSGSAVTATVTEIRYNPMEFVIVAQVDEKRLFVERFGQICRRLREALIEGREEPATSPDASVDESDASIFRSVTGKDPLEVLASTFLDHPQDLLLPEVVEMLDGGPRIVRSFPTEHNGKAREACRDYLSSRRPLWPAVRMVTVEGPFEVLESGLHLIDVPGLNDPDPVRNQVAKDALQRAELVWLVLNAKRAMTGEIMRFLAESKLLTRLELDGRLGSLVTVATHADQFDDVGIIDEYGLDNDVDLSTLLGYHRQRVESHVRRSLRRAWDESVAAAGEHIDPETAEAGRTRLDGMPFFSVASTESLMLRKIGRSRHPPSFDSDAQTGIPELINWMTTTFVDQERKAHLDRIESRAAKLRDTMASALAHRERLHRELAASRDRQKGGLRDLEGRARAFLDERLQEHGYQAAKETEANSEKVRTAIRVGVQEAEAEIRQQIPERLRGIHPMSLRAICRRGGVFQNASNSWDLPAEIANVITKRVAFRWAELFETASTHFLQSVASKSGDLLSESVHLLYGLVAEVVGKDVPGIERPKQPTRQLEYELDTIQSAITQQLQHSRMTFERDLMETLREGLAPAFERAAAERGTGMKSRIVDVIVTSLDREALVLLPALSRDLDEKVREVNLILMDQVERAHQRVRERSAIEAGNLEAALFVRTPDQLIEAANHIKAALSMLDAA